MIEDWCELVGVIGCESGERGVGDGGNLGGICKLFSMLMCKVLGSSFDFLCCVVVERLEEEVLLGVLSEKGDL